MVWSSLFCVFNPVAGALGIEYNAGLEGVEKFPFGSRGTREP